MKLTPTSAPKAGHAVLVRSPKDGTIQGQANLEFGRAAQRIEVDLARAHRRPNGIFEYQFVQLAPLSETQVTYALSVRLDEILVAHRAQEARWLSFVEECKSTAPGRSAADVDAAFGRLQYENAKSMTIRALAERMSRLGRHGTVTFATLDGGDIARLVESAGAELQIELEAVVEVTMDVSTLSELGSSITGLGNPEARR
jgi:hypothetical protein